MFMCALALLLSLSGVAQVFRSTISGTVIDPTRAVVPGVQVVATEVKTGTRVQAVTNNAGHYVLPFLLPGEYTIAASRKGFKRFVREGITVSPQADLSVDIMLEIGEQTQSVIVKADVPLLDRTNASIGQTISTQEVEDLPVNGGTPIMLAEFAIGMLNTADPSQVHPFDNGGASNWSIGGSRSQSSEILLDGAPDMLWNGTLAYSPPEDSVSEVTVKTFDTDAAYGHTAAGVVDEVLKNGTNGFHGTAYGFDQPSGDMANEYFNNRYGIPREHSTYRQYGFGVGGPVYLPKLFDGRNKLFWFIAMENLEDSRPSAYVTTVPTAAERLGDFSQLLTLGSNYTIYNPYSGVLNGRTIDRSPFPDNKIPAQLISPVAQAYMKYYPQPNIPGGADGELNYATTIPNTDNFNNELGRLAWNMNKKSHTTFDFRHNVRNTLGTFFNNVATGASLVRSNWGSSLDEVYTITPSTILDVRGDWTFFRQNEGPPSHGFDPTSLGFPSYIASASQYLAMPEIQFQKNCNEQESFQCFGYKGSPAVVTSNSYQLFSELSTVIGNQTIELGLDARQYRVDDASYGESSGYYRFESNWTNGPTSGSASSPWGQDFAAFLLGLPKQGQLDNEARESLHSNYFAGYFQDNWRVLKTLTLNLGIRFDHDSPYVEKLGRAVNGFDTTTPSPIAAAAEAAYASNPIPEIPASSFAVNGGLTFASPSNGALYQQESHLFSPRFGFAWSPEFLHNNTVIRGGFGMFVGSAGISSYDTNGTYSSVPFVNQEGFSQTTQMVTTLDNYLTPAATLSDPFPNGFMKPTGSSLGLGTFLGQNISFFSPRMKDPYSLRWDLSIQHAFGRNTVIETDYIGNRQEHVPIQYKQLNSVPRQYLSTLPYRDNALISNLTATVANPFHNLLPGTRMNGKTIQLAQLLTPFPQFPNNGILMENLPEGNSYFNAFAARVEHRVSHGLTLIGVYQFSKAIDADLFLNPTDNSPTRNISRQDYPQHFVLAFSYKLPIGRGQLFNVKSYWANLLAGGWIVNGEYLAQSGSPLVWGTDMIYNGDPLHVDSRNTTGVAFNTSAFNTNSQDQFEYHVRTFPYTLSSARQDGIDELSSSIDKEFTLFRSVRLQLRAEAFNTLNHPTFRAPNTTPTSSEFGKITSQGNLPRSIQLGAELRF
jgi:hypothetical protein